MTILYLTHSILKLKNTETQEASYELVHWFISTSNRDIARKRIAGYFKSYKEAEDRHNEIIVKGLLWKDKAHD